MSGHDGKKKRKVMIVIEETGVGEGFQVKLEGDIQRILKNEKDLSPAEVWGDKLFKVCVALLERTGIAASKLPPLKKAPVLNQESK